MQAIFVTARGTTCKRLWALDADLAAAFEQMIMLISSISSAHSPPGDWSGPG